MPEIHLRRPGLTYSVCGPFTLEKERTQKSKETGDLRYIYQNELRKYCFRHHTAYGDFKNLTRRRASHRIQRNEVFNIAENPKYDGYQGGPASKVYTFF